MKIHEIKLYQEFDAPVETVWETFSNHTSFGKMMGINVERIVDSTDPADINGVGSVRLIKVPLFGFEETVIKSEKPSCIEYHISRGTPLNHHLGKILFKPLPGGRSAVDYNISVGSKVPLIGNIVKTGLEKAMGKSLKSYAARLKK